MPPKRRAAKTARGNAAIFPEELASPAPAQNTASDVNNNTLAELSNALMNFKQNYSCAALEKSVQPFSGSATGNPEEWLATYDRYTKLKRWDEATSTLSFPLFLQDTALAWYDGLQASTQTNYSELRGLFLAEFSLSQSQIYSELAKLADLKQGKETVEAYMLDVARRCKRLGRTDTQQLEYVIQGLRPEIRRQVLLQEPTTLAQVRRVATLCETVDTKADTAYVLTLKEQLAEKDRELEELKAGQQHKNKWPRRTQNDRRPYKGSQRKDCGRCGESHKFKECPAYGTECGKCKKLNHWSKMCRTKVQAAQSEAPSQANSTE
jgi:hypothetical protein